MAYSEKKLIAALAVALASVVVLVLATPCAAQSVKDSIVALHNKARDDVGVKPVSWNASLASYALSYAEARQDDCELKYSDGPYGENLFYGRAGKNWTVGEVVGSWVSQKQYYDHDTNTCAEGKVCRGYTQVVWRRTTTIGCDAVACTTTKGGIFVVCSYNPPGNLDGQSPY